MSESLLEKSNKRILVLANNDIGLYHFRINLLRQLIAQGNKVYISLPNGEFIPKLQETGCCFLNTPVDRRGMNPLTDIKLYLHYRKLINENSPDFVITYTIKPNIYGGAACAATKIPYAANITGLGSSIENGGFLKNMVFVMYKYALRKAKTIFFENSSNLDELVLSGTTKRDKTCLLPGAGIDLEEYSAVIYPSSSPIRFLFIGRIMKEKGVNELFSAFKRLKDEYHDMVQLDFVGFFEESYREQVETLSRENIINFYGYQSNVKPFLASCHCLVLSSYHEGMSNVLLEAAATERPLITSDIPGCREAVVDGVSGYLCKVRDADSLYKVMKRFVKLSNDARIKMGQEGRALMERSFAKKAVVDKTISYLFG
jgi:Glycosyltransferase